MELIGRTLNDGAEDDVLPMLFEQIAEEVFERPFISWQVEDVAPIRLTAPANASAITRA